MNLTNIPTLPKLEAEPTNDTAALTCYALDWRERALRSDIVVDELLAALDLLLPLVEQPTVYGYFEIAKRAETARAAIAKAKGD